MADVPESNFFDPDRGHASGRLRQLASVRDMLTDLLLMPQEYSLRPLRALGVTVPLLALRVNGVAIYQATPEAVPRLVIFASKDSPDVMPFLGALRGLGFEISVIPNVSFEAAARPVQGGESIGHGTRGGAAGTMGCVVQSRTTGDRFALTCNHVIADLNKATVGVTEVWEPASGKRGSSRLGVVANFAAIDFTPGAQNTIDAAISSADRPSDIDSYVKHIGHLSGTNSSPIFGATMKKSGAETAKTDGTYYFDINANITYDDGSVALFHDLLGIVGTTKAFAAKGDSGAIVVDDRNAATGMIISVATGIDLTLACRIIPVLKHFDVDVV